MNNKENNFLSNNAQHEGKLLNIVYLLGKINNTINKAKAAIKYHQFSLKLIQIRIAEMRAKYLCMTPFYKKPALPRDIVIRLTERCFLHCAFCAQGKEGGRVDRKNLKEPSIQFDTLKKIIDETARWKIKPFYKFTGGEPLTMGTPLIEFIKQMRDQKFIVKLNTNGMLLKNKRIAEKIAGSDLNYLSISLDGPRDVHNRLRGNDRLFDAIMEGIDNVQYYRNKLKKKNLMILISMVVSSENYTMIEDVYKIACDKKIDWFNIQFLNFTTPETCEASHEYIKQRFGIDEAPWKYFCDPKYNTIDAVHVEKSIKRIMAQRKDVPISVLGGYTTSKKIAEYYFTVKPLKKNICLIPFTGMNIVMPGKAIYCIDYPFYEYGDIRNESIESVWYGEKATQFREDLRKYYKLNKTNYPHCQRCNWRFN